MEEHHFKIPTLDGTIISATTYGQKEYALGHVIFINAFGASKLNLSHIAIKLAEFKYHAICFDNRGIGETIVPGLDNIKKLMENGVDIIEDINKEALDTEMDEQEQTAKAAIFSYDDMVNDVVAILDFFTIEKAHIAGASMGGNLTLLFGITNPTRCVSLSVLASGFPLNDGIKWAFKKYPEYFKRSSSAEREKPKKGDSFETIIEKLRYGWDLMTGPDGGVNTFVDKKDIEHRSIGVKMQLENDTYDFLGLSRTVQTLAMLKWETSYDKSNIDSQLNELGEKIPVIFISGRYDPIAPIEFQLDVASKIPNSRVYEFDCGHELPQRYLDGAISIFVSHFKYASSFDSNVRSTGSKL